MSGIDIIAGVLYIVVAITLIQNLADVYVKTNNLKAEGQTPLTGKNLTTVLLAGLAELLFVMFLVWVTPESIADTETPLEFIALLSLFTAGYLIRNVVAYLTAWGVWTVFVKSDKKKQAQKQSSVNEEQETEEE